MRVLHVLKLNAIKGNVLGFWEVIQESPLQGGNIWTKSEKYKFAFQLLTWWSSKVLFNFGMRNGKEKTKNVDD